MFYLIFPSPLNILWLSKSAGELQGHIFGIADDLIINQKTSGQAKRCVCVCVCSESCGRTNSPCMHRPPDCVSCLEKVLVGSCLQISQAFLYELHRLQKSILAHIPGAGSAPGDDHRARADADARYLQWWLVKGITHVCRLPVSTSPVVVCLGILGACLLKSKHFFLCFELLSVCSG